MNLWSRKLVPTPPITHPLPKHPRRLIQTTINPLTPLRNIPCTQQKPSMIVPRNTPHSTNGSPHHRSLNPFPFPLIPPYPPSTSLPSRRNLLPPEGPNSFPNPPLLPCAVVAPFKDETSPNRVLGIHIPEVSSSCQIIKLASAEEERRRSGFNGWKCTMNT